MTAHNKHRKPCAPVGIHGAHANTRTHQLPPPPPKLEEEEEEEEVVGGKVARTHVGSSWKAPV